jgi:hypothetical protein
MRLRNIPYEYPVWKYWQTSVSMWNIHEVVRKYVRCTVISTYIKMQILMSSLQLLNQFQSRRLVIFDLLARLNCYNVQLVAYPDLLTDTFFKVQKKTKDLYRRKLSKVTV